MKLSISTDFGSPAHWERAQRILTNAPIIREKFERNARGEVNAEEEWARVLGDYTETDEMLEEQRKSI